MATAQTVDFLYTCESHLKDPGFASRIADDPPSKPGLSAEEIAQVKADWEQRQKRKAEKSKGKEGKGEEKEKDDGKTKDDKTTKTPPKATSPAPAQSPPQPSHEKYALHRDMFALRTAEHRKRKQTAQAKELAPRLPGAPRNTVN